MFKSMMVQKNIDLELKALAILQKHLGHSPEAYMPGSCEESNSNTSLSPEEDERILLEVIEYSKKEFDLKKSMDEAELEKLVEVAKQESTRLFEAAEKERQILAEGVSKMGLNDLSPSGMSSVSSMNVELSESVGKVSEVSSPQSTIRDLPELPNMTSPQRQSPLSPDMYSPESSGGESSSDAAAKWLESAKAELHDDQPSSGSIADLKKSRKLAVSHSVLHLPLSLFLILFVMYVIVTCLQNSVLCVCVCVQFTTVFLCV